MNCMLDWAIKETRLVTVYETVTLCILTRFEFGFQYGMNNATTANLRHVVEVLVEVCHFSRLAHVQIAIPQTRIVGVCHHPSFLSAVSHLLPWLPMYVDFALF